MGVIDWNNLDSEASCALATLKWQSNSQREFLEALIVRIETLQEAMRKYGSHTEECWVNDGLERGCNCGFSALMMPITPDYDGCQHTLDPGEQCQCAAAKERRRQLAACCACGVMHVCTEPDKSIEEYEPCDKCDGRGRIKT